MRGEKSICFVTTGIDKDKLEIFGSTKKRAFEKKGGVLRMLVRLTDSIVNPSEGNQTISLKQAVKKINNVLRKLGQEIEFENWLTNQKGDYRNLIVSVFYATKTQMERS